MKRLDAFHTLRRAVGQQFTRIAEEAFGLVETGDMPDCHCVRCACVRKYPPGKRKRLSEPEVATVNAGRNAIVCHPACHQAQA